MRVDFSPPDITDTECQEVLDALQSGWITTGPRTKSLEKRVAERCGTSRAVCLNSATASLELTLRVLGIGPGDEVIVPAYTYTASASPVSCSFPVLSVCSVCLVGAFGSVCSGWPCLGWAGAGGAVGE